MRPMMTVILTLLAVFGISPAWAQETAGHASEIDLILPDLAEVDDVLGTSGRTLLIGGLLVCLLGLVFGCDLHALTTAGPQVDARRRELIYETCKTYLIKQGKFSWSSSCSSARHGLLLRLLRDMARVAGGVIILFAWSASAAPTRWPGSASA